MGYIYKHTNKINHGNISECCKGRRNQAGGYKWMYKEDYYVTNTGS